MTAFGQAAAGLSVLHSGHEPEFMLRPVSLAQQWREIQRRLPDDWADARLLLIPADESKLERTLALLGPLSPGHHGQAVRFFVARRGAGPAPEAVLRMLRLLDAEGIEGRLELLESARLAPPAQPTPSQTALAESWDQALAELPEDWSEPRSPWPPSTRPATRAPRDSASGSRACPGTAPRRRWPGAASPGSTRRESR